MCLKILAALYCDRASDLGPKWGYFFTLMIFSFLFLFPLWRVLGRLGLDPFYFSNIIHSGLFNYRGESVPFEAPFWILGSVFVLSFPFPHRKVRVMSYYLRGKKNWRKRLYYVFIAILIAWAEIILIL